MYSRLLLLVVALFISSCSSGSQNQDRAIISFVSIDVVNLRPENDKSHASYAYDVTFSSYLDFSKVYDKRTSTNLYCIIGGSDNDFLNVIKGDGHFFARGPIEEISNQSEQTENNKKRSYIYKLRLQFMSQTTKMVTDFDMVENVLNSAQKRGDNMVCQVGVIGYNNKKKDESSTVNFLRYWFSKPKLSHSMTIPIDSFSIEGK
ncbi:hypothetical protein V3F60_004061 [Salmonella enterica]